MKIGVLGLGTVGGGVVNIINDNFKDIKQRTGIEVIVEQICVKDLAKTRSCDITDLDVITDPFLVVNNPNIDVIVELIGGITLAKELVELAIANKKHVVTANKALIANHGNELIKQAEKQGVQLLFEAAVAGGIPILNVLKTSLLSNKIEYLVGIINGTGNFILSEMKEKNREFNDVLKEAQELGYAEADPTFDVEGIDAAHKLAILSAMAFGTNIDFSKVWTQGITKLEPLDVLIADELGYTIKHLGIAKNVDNKLQMRVHPTLLPKERLMANVNGVMNAVLVKGNTVGTTLYYGAGAGAGPTASAVMADVLNITKNNSDNVMGWHSLEDVSYQTIEEVKSPHYLRLNVADKAGVLADITKIFASCDISIEAVIQKESSNKDDAMIAIITNECLYSSVNEAIVKIKYCDFINSDIKHILIETLN